GHIRGTLTSPVPSTPEPSARRRCAAPAQQSDAVLPHRVRLAALGRARRRPSRPGASRQHRALEPTPRIALAENDRGGNDMSVELTIKLPNRAGQLGALAGALGDAGISMRSIAATTGGGAGTVYVVVDDKDAAKARRAIKAKKYRISADRKIVEIRLGNKPGTLARAATRLGKNKVNIESAYMLGSSKKSTTLGLGVKDARAAKKALGRR